MVFALVLCSTVNAFAKEDIKESNKLDENLSDYLSFEFAEEILFDNKNMESIHLERCDGDFRYILDLPVSTQNENVRSNEEIKYGAEEFKSRFYTACKCFFYISTVKFLKNMHKKEKLLHISYICSGTFKSFTCQTK